MVTKSKTKQKSIFEFNSIDTNLSEEKIKEIKAFYEHYHKKSWVYKTSYTRKKR